MAELRKLYFDSALIAKFYLNEPGRDDVRRLAVSAGVVISSSIAVAEVAAAFHRKLRENALDTDVFEALQLQFSRDVRQGMWTMVPVSDALLGSVHLLFSKLASKVFLHSLDALHLVTARSEGLAAIHSNDRHLLAACESRDQSVAAALRFSH
jgi:predicted nucleic acid-binding protein